MILTRNLDLPNRKVVRSQRESVALLDSLRPSASREVGVAFDDVSGKRITRAGLPGVTRHSISRAVNGCTSNPLLRLAGWFVLARQLGIPKHRLQRLINWLQAALDAAYADEEQPTLEEIHQQEQDRDCAEDAAQMRAATSGDREAMTAWLDRVLDHHAYIRATVIPAVAATLWLRP